MRNTWVSYSVPRKELFWRTHCWVWKNVLNLWKDLTSMEEGCVNEVRVNGKPAMMSSDAPRLVDSSHPQSSTFLISIYSLAPPDPVNGVTQKHSDSAEATNWIGRLSVFPFPGRVHAGNLLKQSGAVSESVDLELQRRAPSAERQSWQIHRMRRDNAAPRTEKRAPSRGSQKPKSKRLH